MLTLPRVGDEFAGYRLLAVLGRGGMSVVYQAENPRLGSLAALKVLAPELAEDDVFRTRFLQESRTAASLTHPNVIPIYDMGTHEDLLFIAMRYVAGSDLRTLIRDHHRLTPADSLYAATQAGRALDLAHRHGLVHRDVKPGNILLEAGADADDPDHVYLADFGIAKHTLSRSGLTDTGQFVGTVHYVAPEQIQGHPIDGRADQYALACVLFECLTGRAPFVRDVDAAVLWAHVEEPAPCASTVRVGLPEALDGVLAKAMAKDPVDRYATCRDFTAAAGAALGSSGRWGRLLSRSAPVGRQPRHSDPNATQPPPHGDADPPGSAEASPTGKTPESAASSPPPGPPPPGAPTSDHSASGQPSPRRDPAHERRRRAVLAAAAACVVAGAAAGSAVWVFSHDGNSLATERLPTSSTTDNPILTAIEKLGDARLPVSSCQALGGDHVVCTSPDVGVAHVDLRRYPSVHALYDGYVAAAEALTGRPFRANQRNCNGHSTNGEISWNHEYHHPRGITLAQSRSDRLEAMQANGRVFCDYVADAMHFVWTDNSGLLLGTVDGYEHPSTWDWWHTVHHDLNVGYWAAHDPSSSPEPADTDMPGMGDTDTPTGTSTAR
ncbi:serine/threonine protein kinase [Nocardioides sp. HB32]